MSKKHVLCTCVTVLTGRSIVGIGTDLTLSFSKGQDAGSFMGAVCACVCVCVCVCVREMASSYINFA